MTIAQRIIAVAEAELGVTEQPPGSNRGQRVEHYQSFDWLTGGGYAWCVSFAWGFVVWHSVLKKPNPYPTASVAQLAGWGERNGWAVPVASIRIGDLACLGNGRHVTIVHHLLPGGSRFAGIGGNQSDSVRVSEYDRSDITTLLRVPSKLAPPKPAPTPPKYEVVRGEGEKERVVYTGPRAGALKALDKVLAKGAWGGQVRKVKKP